MKDIGHIKGKVMLFGGVYSNYHALVALQEVAKKNDISPSNIICTGDVIAYCAEARESIEAIEDWGIHCIAGNVELNLLDQADDCGCNFNEGSRCDVFSRQWYPYAKSMMQKRHLNYMSQLPQQLRFTYNEKHVTVLHGGIENVSEYIFKSTLWSRKQEIFDSTESDVIIAGHSGLPFLDIHNNKTWINAGVIGMPANDGGTYTWYAIIDDSMDDISVEFHHLEYNYMEASQLMLDNNLPSEYAETLKTGLWDNCEILPDYETSQQGKEINLIDVIL